MKPNSYSLLYKLSIIFLSLVVLNSCSVLKKVQDMSENLKRLQFKLDNVNNFRLAGVNLSNISSVKDLSLSDALKLTNAFSSKRFPAEFVLNVEAKNPNDGTGKTKKSSATLTAFDWKLYLDNKETIAGDIAKSIVIPGTGEAEIIPLTMSLDLYEFFGNQGYDKLINLALAIGGKNGSASNIKLDARPTVSTSLGAITYPGRINIVDKSWTN